MTSPLTIRPLKESDIPKVTEWARVEGFTPGTGDLSIYQHTDRQGLWIGSLDKEPIGCIAGVRYNAEYGFIGMFLVIPEQRGKGYGVELWKQALKHLVDVPCIGLEAAPERVEDYSRWNFVPSSSTTRWQFEVDDNLLFSLGNVNENYSDGMVFVEGDSIPSNAIEIYDALREPSPRPHFLRDWLNHPSGKVLCLIDHLGLCHGFGRIRPCLLKEGVGWRIGPLLADTPILAELLLKKLLYRHPGIVLLDSPGLNLFAEKLFKKIGFNAISHTVRMYRGKQPPISMDEVYGLACLELG